MNLQLVKSQVAGSNISAVKIEATTQTFRHGLIQTNCVNSIQIVGQTDYVFCGLVENGLGDDLKQEKDTADEETSQITQDQVLDGLDIDSEKPSFNNFGRE